MSQKALLEDGFFVAKNKLSMEVIGQMRDTSICLVEQECSEERVKVRSNGSMINIARYESFAPLLAAPEILNELAELGGEDIRWTGGYLISKPAGGPPLFWHQDWWAWNEAISYAQEPAQLFVMVYLTPTVQDNGCLRVIPHSHHKWHELHDVAAAHSEQLAAYQDANDPVFSDHPDEVAVCVEPGDLVIGDSRLLHGAYANKSDNERPLLTLWYVPNFNQLPVPIRARYSYQMRYQDGDLQERKGHIVTPYDWSQSAYDLIAPILPDEEPCREYDKWQRLPDCKRFAAARI